MLSALLVLAIVGSALAFKAHSTFGGNLKCATFTTSKGAPTLPAAFCTSRTYTTTNSGFGTVRHCKAINNVDPDNPCVATWVTVNP